MAIQLITTTGTEHDVIPEWTIADRLRKARESAGLDQPHLAALMTISRTSVSNYERGFTTPRPLVVREWSRVTGVPVWWLRGEPRPRQESTDYQTLVRGSQIVTGAQRHLKAV